MSSFNPFQKSSAAPDGTDPAAASVSSAGIPGLGTSGQRKLNVKVLVFIGLLALGILGLFYYMIGSGNRKEKAPPKEQVLSIPQPPVMPKPAQAELPPSTPVGAPQAAPDPGLALRLRRTGGGAKPGTEAPKLGLADGHGASGSSSASSAASPAYVVTSYGAPSGMASGSSAPEISGPHLARRRALESGGVATVLGGRQLSTVPNRNTGTVGNSAVASTAPAAPLSALPPGLRGPDNAALGGPASLNLGASPQAPISGALGLPLGLPGTQGTGINGSPAWGVSAPLGNPVRSSNATFGVPSGGAAAWSTSTDAQRGGPVQQLNQESPTYTPPSQDRMPPALVPPGLQAPGANRGRQDLSQGPGPSEPVARVVPWWTAGEITQAQVGLATPSLHGSAGQVRLDAAPTFALMQADEGDGSAELGRVTSFPVNQARSVPIDPGSYIPQGTAMRCVLQTLIMTDIPGPTTCTLVEDIRSFDARRVLLPRGSRVMGEYRPTANSVDRVAIIWTRVITPQNIDISINSPGISPLGTLGVQGEVDNRWGERLSGALMLSLASDAFKYAVQTRGPTIETVTYNAQGVPIVTRQPFDSATIRNAERFVEQDLTRALRVPPRIVILQGTVVSILTAQDLSFSQVLSGR